MKICGMLLLSLFLASCASTSPQMITLNSESAKKAAAIQNWVADGAIGVKTPDQAGSASFHWVQQGQNTYSLLIFGPFGAGAVRLNGNANGVQLTNSKGIITHAEDPETLLEQELGWSIPVSNLYYWIRGLPAPNLPGTPHYDAQGRLIALEQQGWSIQYLNYTTIQRIQLPTKIVMIAPASDVSVRVIVNQWKI